MKGRREVTQAVPRESRHSSGSVLEISLPAVPSVVSHMRSEARQFAAEHGASGELAFDISLVVSEAVTNAVKYAYGTGVSGSVQLSAAVDDGFLQLSVRDQGAGFGTGSSDGLGLGLTIIARLSDEMTVLQAGEGTEVRMRFALPES